MEELQLGVPYTPKDDHCNWLPVILYRMRARALIRSGILCGPEPKPIYVGSILLPQAPTAPHIGARRYYSSTIMLAVYQLHRSGINENLIAKDTRIPVVDIRKLLVHNTQTQRRQWQLAQQLPLPSKGAILTRLAKEA